MMKLYRYPEKKDWIKLARRPVADYAALENPVRNILEKVKQKGDKAVRRYTKRFDGVETGSLAVGPNEINRAAGLLDEELKSAIRLAKKNIEAFHQTQQINEPRTEIVPGVNCWRKAVGIEKVGLYIPGGSAPLFSTVLMLAIPARLAGCKEIILCTPPGRDGSVHPAILYAAQLCGVTGIFRAGGAQAVAAMAYGTESIPAVYKIFGPGNQYVTMAKQLVQQEGLAIDLPAGPSEVLVIADETAVPEFVAADLLSQAEHGPDSQVILVTTGESIAQEVQQAITGQLKRLPRKKIAVKALRNSRILLARNLEEAIGFSNLYAPEHLILSVANPEPAAAKVTSAGSVFLGNYSPESAGDYASGTNHTLPTNGYAAMYSGVSLDSFTRKITFQELNKEGLNQIGNAVMTMAAAEGLEAHRQAVAIRLKPNHAI